MQGYLCKNQLIFLSFLLTIKKTRIHVTRSESISKCFNKYVVVYPFATSQNTAYLLVI